MTKIPFGRSVEDFLKQHPPTKLQNEGKWSVKPAPPNENVTRGEQGSPLGVRGTANSEAPVGRQTIADPEAEFCASRKDVSAVSREEYAFRSSALGHTIPCTDMAEDEQELFRLFHQSPTLRLAREKAQQFLGLACKPSGAVRRKLQGLGFETEVIETVLADLEREGFLNDEELAGRRIRRQCQGRRNENRQVLFQRLLQQGFQAEAICRALDRELPDEQQLIQAYLLSKQRSWIEQLRMCKRSEGSLPHNWFYQDETVRVLRQAGRRGFAPHLVRAAVEHILGEDTYE